MARSAEWCPDVPLEYRGIEVCDYVAYRWDMPEGQGWRMGIDQALDSVSELVSGHVKEVEFNAPTIFFSDWAEGAQYGREDALDELTTDMRKYSK